MQNDFLQKLMQAVQGGQPQAPSVADTNQQTQQDPFQGMSMPQLMQQGLHPTRRYNLETQSVIEPNPLKGMHPVESQAATQAISAGADPGWLSSMSQMLGKNQFLGLCEAFVEQATKGVQGLYASAIDAWNRQQGIARQGLNGIKPGDAVYFGADSSNGGNGHTGVYVGNGEFVGATYNGIKKYNLDNWQKATGQKLLGYVPESGKPPIQPVQQKPQPMPSAPQSPTAGLIPPPVQKPPVQPMMSTQPQRMSVPRAPIHAQNNPLAGLLGLFGRKA